MERLTQVLDRDRIEFHLQVKAPSSPLGVKRTKKAKPSSTGSAFNTRGLLRPGVTAAEKLAAIRPLPQFLPVLAELASGTTIQHNE